MNDIVKFPSEVLEQTAIRVELFDENLWKLLDQMKEVMLAQSAVGLAAPQIGQQYQVFVASEDGSKDKLIEYINPEIISQSQMIPFREGCLSIPNLGIDTFRYSNFSIRYQTRTGSAAEVNATGFLAIILQHEYDHLQGKTIAQFLNSSQRRFLKRSLGK